tara:strand:+ start:337 stop:579 length:243 start_codon:yes stop_codon:yes gene_type:complete
MTIEKRLISKKEILQIAIMLNNFGFKRDELKKMKVNDLRQLCKITHIIDGKPKNYYGHCFSCLKPLRADYTSFENYCADC